MGKGQIIAICIVLGLLILVVIAVAVKNLLDSMGNKKTSKNGSLKSENINRKDMNEYLSMIEDVVDGILITDKGTRFITGIKCRGIDFYNQSATEQLSTMRGYQKFFNIATDPIQYAIYTKAFDIDYSKEKYMNRLNETYEVIDEAEKRYRGMINASSPEELKEMETFISTMKRRTEHLADELRALEVYSDAEIVQDVDQNYFFEWVYQEDSRVPLTKNEIFERAKQSLEAIVSQKVNALRESGVKAKQFTQSDMEDFCRHVLKPYSADQYKQKDLEESSFEEDVITSDSIKNAMNFIKNEVSANMPLPQVSDLVDIVIESENEADAEQSKDRNIPSSAVLFDEGRGEL